MWKDSIRNIVVIFQPNILRIVGFYVRHWALDRGWGEKKCTDKLPFYNYFKPNFRHLHEYLSQNWGSDGHFEALNRSIPQLVQKLWHKAQLFPFLFLCDFVKKIKSVYCFWWFWSFLCFLCVFHFCHNFCTN